MPPGRAAPSPLLRAPYLSIMMCCDRGDISGREAATLGKRLVPTQHLCCCLWLQRLGKPADTWGARTQIPAPGGF